MKKEAIISACESAFEDILNWISKYDQDHFGLVQHPGKWSAGQHIDHLVRSIVPVTGGLNMSKAVLQAATGRLDRPEIEPKSLQSKYEKILADGAVAAGKFLPEDISNDQKDELHHNLDKAQKHFIQSLEHWSEDDLSAYVFKHPVLGKLSVREMMYFTELHTRHHLHILEERY